MYGTANSRLDQFETFAFKIDLIRLRNDQKPLNSLFEEAIHASTFHSQMTKQ